MSGKAFIRDEKPDKLEGMKMKYTIIKNSDIERLPLAEKGYLGVALNWINNKRFIEGKKENKYIMINVDEPYAEEVIEIMKRHGHWG